MLKDAQNIFAVAILALAVVTASVQAHPEDEFCIPGEDSLDPELCAALAELDSPSGRTLDEKPIVDAEGNVRGWWSTATLYVTIGVRHILPDGLDHILPV